MSAAPVMQKAPPPFRPLLFCGSSFAFLLPPILSCELDFWSMFRHRAQSFCTGTRPSSMSLQSWQGENNFVIWLPGQDESKADGSNLYHLTGLMTFVYAVFVWWFLVDLWLQELLLRIRHFRLLWWFNNTRAIWKTCWNLIFLYWSGMAHMGFVLQGFEDPGSTCGCNLRDFFEGVRWIYWICLIFKVSRSDRIADGRAETAAAGQDPGSSLRSLDLGFFAFAGPSEHQWDNFKSLARICLWKNWRCFGRFACGFAFSIFTFCNWIPQHLHAWKCSFGGVTSSKLHFSHIC